MQSVNQFEFILLAIFNLDLECLCKTVGWKTFEIRNAEFSQTFSKLHVLKSFNYNSQLIFSRSQNSFEAVYLVS